MVAGLVELARSRCSRPARFNAEQIARLQPAKTAAMEGLFETQPNAPLAIIGMPDSEKGILLDPIDDSELAEPV